MGPRDTDCLGETVQFGIVESEPLAEDPSGVGTQTGSRPCSAGRCARKAGRVGDVMLGAADGMFDLVECGPAQEMREDLLGPVTIETYAVHYDRQGAPRGGAVMGRAADGARTLAHVRPEDEALIAFLTDGAAEPVGTAGGVAQADGKRIFTRE